MNDVLDGKTILIIGGIGRLGSVLVDEIVTHGGSVLLYLAVRVKSCVVQQPKSD